MLIQIYYQKTIFDVIKYDIYFDEGQTYLRVMKQSNSLPSLISIRLTKVERKSKGNIGCLAFVWDNRKFEI